MTEAFAYAAEANVNQGVIAGVLSSNIIFTSIIFYLVYGEKITFVNKICMLIIIAGVVCVSIKQEKSFEQKEIIYEDLLISVAYALVTGFSFAIGTFVIKYYMARAKFNATRFNVDGLMVSAIPMSIALYLRH